MQRQCGSTQAASMDKPVRAKGRAYEIRAFNESEFAQWDEFVRQSPQGTLFHSSLWLEAAGAPFRLLACFRGGELHGGFAVAVFDKHHAGAPHPALTPYLGVLFPPNHGKYVTKISNHKAVASAFAAFLKKEFDTVNLRFPPEVVDLQPFIWEGFEAGLRYTYRLPLNDLEQALGNMDTDRRHNIISAERQGVQVESGANFEEVLRLSERSFQRQGLATTTRPAAKKFEASLRAAGLCRTFLARSPSGAPIGGVWIAWDDKRAYYLLGGYEVSAKSNNAVALAMWRAIQYAASTLKLAEFDFEGSMIPAVEQFFRKFGAVLTPTYTVWYRKPVGLPRRAARKLIRIFGARV
jgi:Acetyltransferase (GNAT) domain